MEKDLFGDTDSDDSSDIDVGSTDTAEAEPSPSKRTNSELTTEPIENNPIAEADDSSKVSDGLIKDEPEDEGDEGVGDGLSISSDSAAVSGDEQEDHDHDDSDQDQDNEKNSKAANGTGLLTGFLFGNVDTKTGKLENNYLFDDTTDVEKHLRGLQKLGGVSAGILEDEATEGDQNNKPKKKESSSGIFGSDSESDSDEEPGGAAKASEFSKLPQAAPAKSVAMGRKDSMDDYDDDDKSPSAEDFSDIQELATDDDYLAQQTKLPLTLTMDQTDYDGDTELDDQRKMPPPTSLPIKTPTKTKPPDDEIPTTSTSTTTSTSSSEGDSSSSSGSQSTTPTTPNEKKLDTPLAAMLPSKYAGVEVTTLFPDFRSDKVLRFARLFGPGKSTSLPQNWKNVKKRRRKRLSLDGDPSKERRGSTDRASADLSDDAFEDVKYEIEDDEKYYLQCSEGDEDEEQDDANKTKVEGKTSSVPPAIWRHGPASLWFDMFDVPENATSFDYGFSTESPTETEDKENECDDDEKPKPPEEKDFADEAFHLVTQGDWESQIIWDGHDAKVKKWKSKNAGWVPSGVNRTAHVKGEASPNTKSGPLAFPTPPTPPTKHKKGHHVDDQSQVDETSYSIFPVESDELVKGLWEEEVIWDIEKVSKTLEPKVVALDPNDKNIILCMPDDIDPSLAAGKTAPVKVKIPHPHVKKSKILLGKAGVINVIEEDSPPPSPKKDDIDPYNISNDEYYAPRHTEQSLLKISASGNIIQHSTPVVELRAPFIPTHMGPMKLRNFHRPPLKKYSSGPLSSSGPHPVYALTKHIAKKAKQRENERLAAGGGDIFVMRTPEDISGKDGTLILMEYCEEHPPLVNQVGMCSKLKNYFKRHAEKNVAPPELKLGETTFAHTSPFLGAMHPGEVIQTIENNLYRAPIYEHPRSETDFLLVRTRNNFSIREYDHVFTAGQQCPLYEVPGPNSKRANNFVRDFLQVFIYRLFWKSRDNPRRIRMDDIKRAFPMHSESSIRKRLKQCADFKRTGADSNWWVIKPEFRLPTEEEIRAMVSPEQCCAFFSLVAAEQRLKDAGYGEKFLFAPQDDDDEESQGKIDDEVKTAPWNTTRAYIQAMKGKCILQLVGAADPTGVGEGFSYIRVPNKPQTTKEEQESQPKRIVMGTDADLRKLSLSNARNLLRKFMVPEEEIQKLSRWEVIDVVRTLSTEKAKQGEKGIVKFSRGNRFSVAEHQERYKEECQRIFELQNRILMASDPITSDEGESNEEEEVDDAIEEMGKNIENMLSNRKTTSQLVHEKEEQERLELQKMIMGDGKDDDKRKGKKSKQKEKEEAAANEEENKKLNKITATPGRILRITRRFKQPDGHEYTRTETVRKASVIDIYVRMRHMKDEAFIRSFTLLDDQAKEEMKKEKRRIQEQLRRIKRNQEREHVVRAPPPPKKKKIKMKPELKMKCGACGQVGHMRTNKACPYYEGGVNSPPLPSVNVAMTEEQEEEIEKELVADDGEELVKLDGTKVRLSSSVLKNMDEVKRRSLVLKVPREAMKRKKKRDDDNDYLMGRGKTTNRRRIDPRVMISNVFEGILTEIRSTPDSNYFILPVSQKIPKYYEIIKTPMDLQTMRDKIRQKKYDSGADFLGDAALLVQNSTIYNGEKHLVTAYAKKVYELAEQRIKENSSKLSRYEKMINPLLDDNYKRKMNYILSKMIDKVKMLPESASFLKPVNKKTFKNYYEVIENPMDLDTMEKKIRDGLYNSRHDFIHDLDLIHSNAVQYNGERTPIADKAALLGDFIKKALTPFDETLKELEANIEKDEGDKLDSDDEYIGSDGDDMTTEPIEIDSTLSPMKYTREESNDGQIFPDRSSLDYGDSFHSDDDRSRSRAGFSGQISRLSSDYDDFRSPLPGSIDESRKRELSGSFDEWGSEDAQSGPPRKLMRTELDTSNIDSESQQAIEAMMALSKATPSFAPSQSPAANPDDSRQFSPQEEYTSQGIHEDLEVSDSDSDSDSNSPNDDDE